MRSCLAALMLAALLLEACGSNTGNVLIATAVAATAAGISRATGGCYASCTTGTVCNPVNGLCEALPCRGRCADDEQCDVRGLVEKCVPKKADITITTDPEEVPKEESPPPE